MTFRLPTPVYSCTFGEPDPIDAIVWKPRVRESTLAREERHAPSYYDHRRAEIVAMRAENKSWSTIALAYGISKQAAMASLDVAKHTEEKRKLRGISGARACTACGEHGHNRRTCAVK